jgi:hypothetical protein
MCSPETGVCCFGHAGLLPVRAPPVERGAWVPKAAAGVLSRTLIEARKGRTGCWDGQRLLVGLWGPSGELSISSSSILMSVSHPARLRTWALLFCPPSACDVANPALSTSASSDSSSLALPGRRLSSINKKANQGAACRSNRRVQARPGALELEALESRFDAPLKKKESPNTGYEPCLFLPSPPNNLRIPCQRHNGKRIGSFERGANEG